MRSARLAGRIAAAMTTTTSVSETLPKLTTSSNGKPCTNDLTTLLSTTAPAPPAIAPAAVRKSPP